MVVILIGQVNLRYLVVTEPFQSGQSYIFGITPLSPEELINHIMK